MRRLLQAVQSSAELKDLMGLELDSVGGQHVDVVSQVGIKVGCLEVDLMQIHVQHSNECTEQAEDLQARSRSERLLEIDAL
ncbi:hypothetical protein CF336_g8711, partial [Tilletia laevis]